MSKFQCETYTLKWTICDLVSACEKKSLIKSSLFPKEKVDNVQWCLEVQFTKLSQDNQDIFRFSLINTERIRKNVCINISILSNLKIKKIINAYPSCNIITKWELRATELFQVLAIDNRLPTNIVIICEVILMKEVKNALIRSSTPLTRTLQSNELLSQLKNSMADEAFKDVIFKVEDETFTAHKFILALRSPVFAVMLKNHVVEKLIPVFKVEDMRATIFQKVLQFIYTDAVEDIDDLVVDLFYAAEKYELDNLKIMCINNLYQNLSCETVLKTLELADIFSISKLKEESLRFLVTNLATISCKEDFVRLIKKRENLSVEIFKMFGSMNNEKDEDITLHTNFSSLFDEEGCKDDFESMDEDTRSEEKNNPPAIIADHQELQQEKKREEEEKNKNLKQNIQQEEEKIENKSQIKSKNQIFNKYKHSSEKFNDQLLRKKNYRSYSPFLNQQHHLINYWQDVKHHW